jgi:hypothetical protein
MSLFIFCLISTGVPNIERGHQDGLKTGTYIVGGQVMVPLDLFAVIRDSARWR